MIGARGSFSRGSSANVADYESVFLRRVHELLWRGYERLDPSKYESEDEEVITGELVQAIRDVCDDPASPRWVDSYTTHDDPPVNAPGRAGKHRRRVDIEFESSGRRPRLRFSLEAKRLYNSDSVGQYLGDKGLGCFLTAKYARHQPWGGMLGYVQADTPSQWTTEIKSALETNRKKYHLVPGSRFESVDFGKGGRKAHRSRHKRTIDRSRIAIYHTFLRMN